MSRLVWDKVGERLYETGTDRGVLFPKSSAGAYEKGVAWNGLVAVRQSPDGAEPTDIYADNIKYLSLRSAENFKGTIEAYTYPDEFAACDGFVSVVEGASFGQQRRSEFGLAYRTLVGNDTEDTEHGYKLHLIWGAKVAPTERSYETVNNDPNAITFSWAFETTPVPIEDHRPSAYLCLDSTKLAAGKMKDIEDLLWGSGSDEPSLPEPEEIISILKATSGGGGGGS